MTEVRAAPLLRSTTTRVSKTRKGHEHEADYTKEEWDLLLRAPWLAAMVVVAAGPSGPIGVLKELLGQQLQTIETVV